ncbi:MAG: hypothetical protein ACLTER_10930 [Ruminococcus sp.]
MNVGVTATFYETMQGGKQTAGFLPILLQQPVRLLPAVIDEPSERFLPMVIDELLEREMM